MMQVAQVTLESMAIDFGHGIASRKIDTQNDGHQVPVTYNEPSAEALGALNTVTCHPRNNLASLCKGGVYKEFKAAFQLLTEQGMIPSRITSMLKDLLMSKKGGEVFVAQHKEIKARMELVKQKCKKSKDIVSNYDTNDTSRPRYSLNTRIGICWLTPEGDESHLLNTTIMIRRKYT
ncbi:hypothetical protein DVH24_019355 [Malus domestica]|uniref:Uncharacterized protein n=1 Tax=Malus domestica TaxID=3750 RepID=A0A498I3G4_MALDO|nr:hypothetical protein DVH24_019355 [Malus domestica]